MGKAAAAIPKETEKPKRKRRKAEEALVEEAREQVFNGADPNQPESEALALALYAGVVDQPEQQPAAQPSTSSRARRSLAQAQKKEEAMALTLWKKEAAAAATTPATDPPAKRGRGRPPLLRSPESSSSSLALVPLKQSGPKASPASICIAKPAVSALALVKATPLSTNAAAKKKATPKSNNNNDQNNDSTAGNTNSAARQGHVNSRWKEYPQVCEDAVDEVVGAMRQRNANEVQKMQDMRAGILDVIYLGTSVKHSAENRDFGQTTMRRYWNDVKQMLEDCLGNEQFLRQFEHQKKELSLKQLRTEIMKKKAAGGDQAAQQPAEPVVGEEEETPKGKKTPGNRKRKAPKEEEAEEQEADQQKIVETPPTALPKQKEQTTANNNSLNLIKEANNSAMTTSTSKRTRRTPAAKSPTDSAKENAPVPTPATTTATSSGRKNSKKNTAATNNKTVGTPANGPAPANTTGTTEPAEDQTLQLIMAPGKPMKELISHSAQNGERQRFRGTKKQLRDIVTELAKSKYQGDPEDFSEVITDLIVMDRRVKVAMDRHGFPLGLVQMGFKLVNRFYDIEDILEDDEE